jgi:hypothetical protein
VIIINRELTTSPTTATTRMAIASSRVVMISSRAEILSTVVNRAAASED